MSAWPGHERAPPARPTPQKTNPSNDRLQRSPKRFRKTQSPPSRLAGIPPASHIETRHELVILTGLSGSGKLSALKAFEDLGYYSVDNLPVELLTSFAELVTQSVEITRAALVVDVREGPGLERFPAMLREVRKRLSTKVIYLEASKAALLRRFSETRRPHPLGREAMVGPAIQAERKLLDPVRNVADILIDTSSFNVHELRAYIQNQFERELRRQKPACLLPELRLQERSTARSRPRLRCALPA